jgi:hypothetical protein
MNGGGGGGGLQSVVLDCYVAITVCFFGLSPCVTEKTGYLRHQHHYLRDISIAVRMS